MRIYKVSKRYFGAEVHESLLPGSMCLSYNKIMLKLLKSHTSTVERKEVGNVKG